MLILWMLSLCGWCLYELRFISLGKAGTPKTIAGIHTHTTPVLLASAERAELATDQFEIVAPTLDGICVLRNVPDVKA